ncbi:CBS domain-containing protein [Streptomyces buecherae]|uniref:CBS domain-containing protein n=1 Tax=Streptomyces buecherae TaxID=2763006 RepID=UPI003698867C
MPRTPHIVSDVMTQTVVAVGVDAPFKQIVTLMQQWKVSALPVLAGEGRVIGVVSEADLLPKEEFRHGGPGLGVPLGRLRDVAKAGALTARELMSTPAVTVSGDMTLADAARVMTDKHVKRLPVIDAEGMLQGVVSRADLLRVFLRSDEDIAEEVRREVVDYLFPAPASPVRVEVRDGVVTVSGQIRDTALVPVTARLVRAVEGVVDYENGLSGLATLPRVEDRSGAVGR